MRRLNPLLTIALALVVVALTASNLYLILKPEPNPLRYPVPQDIAGVPPYVFQPGGALQTRAIKCNDSDEGLSISGVSEYVRLDVYARIAYRSQATPLVIPARECLDRIFVNTIPLEAEPGIWRLQGQDCITPALVICRNWFTESFQIVGAH